MHKPKSWTEVYPQGTKEGDEENKFFKILARHPQWQYRTTAHLAAESGLSRKRIEEILAKYTDPAKYDPPLIYAHPTQEDHWGYWERVPEHLEKDNRTITKKDQDRRIKKHIQGFDFIEIDLNNIPDEIKITDEQGVDGSCDVQTIKHDGKTYEKKWDKKRISMGIGKIGYVILSHKKYREAQKKKRPMGIGVIGKSDILRHKPKKSWPLVPEKTEIDAAKEESTKVCDKKYKRVEIISNGGFLIYKGDKDAGDWIVTNPEVAPVEDRGDAVAERWHASAIDEDGWTPIRPKEYPKMVEHAVTTDRIPNIYGFKTPEKHAFTLTDGPPKTEPVPSTITVTWNETVVPAQDKIYDLNTSEDVLPPWNTTSYNAQDIIPDESLRIVDTDNCYSEDIFPMDGYDKAEFCIPIPEVPDFPAFKIPDVKIPVSLELPPLIFSCLDIDDNVPTEIKLDAWNLPTEIKVSPSADGWVLDV